jgi:hypothetical protein
MSTSWTTSRALGHLGLHDEDFRRRVRPEDELRCDRIGQVTQHMSGRL